jgi:hypothetical protein
VLSLGVFAIDTLGLPIQFRHQTEKYAACNNEGRVRSVLLLGGTTPTVRSFRLYSEPAPVAPLREVADYPAEERDRLRDAFRSTAAGYRRHGRIAAWCFGGFLCCILLVLVLRKSSPPWFAMVPALVCWIAGFVAMMSAPRLVCPGCSNKMDINLGRYCPECGAPQLQPGGWFRSPRCGSCDRPMRRNKTRGYKIRACTHCGLMLDEAGL